MSFREIVLAAFVTVAVCACNDQGPANGRICTTEARAGIQVRVRDAVTNSPAAHGSVVIAQDQAYADTLRGFFDSLTVAGVYERPGVYTVSIKKAGYRDWQQANVVVTSDECHVITVSLDARLERP